MPTTERRKPILILATERERGTGNLIVILGAAYRGENGVRSYTSSDYSDGRTDNLAGFQVRLRVSAKYHRIGDDCDFGFYVGSEPGHFLRSRDALAMARVALKVERRLNKDAEQFGSCATFGTFLERVAAAIKVQEFAVARFPDAHDHDEAGYEFGGLAWVLQHIAGKVDAYRDVAEHGVVS